MRLARPSVYPSVFQLGFRGSQGFRQHMPGVLRLVSKKIKQINLACEITSNQVIKV